MFKFNNFLKFYCALFSGLICLCIGLSLWYFFYGELQEVVKIMRSMGIFIFALLLGVYYYPIQDWLKKN